jgi:hypothetical protein
MEPLSLDRMCEKLWTLPHEPLFLTASTDGSAVISAPFVLEEFVLDEEYARGSAGAATASYRKQSHCRNNIDPVQISLEYIGSNPSSELEATLAMND